MQTAQAERQPIDLSIRPKLIVFDWDGTLCDSMALIISSMQSAAKQLQMAVPSAQQIKAITGLGLKEAVAELFGVEVAQDLPLQQQLVGYYRQAYAQPSPGEAACLFAGVEPMLEQLKAQGICLAISTGKSRKGLDASLTQTGVGHFFQITRCADESESKPSPQMLKEIFAATGFSADQSWMIGDSIYDLQMANSVAVAAIGVSYGAFEKSQLAQYADACIDGIQQLHKLLLNGSH